MIHRMMVLDWPTPFVVLSFFLQYCFFYKLLSFLDPMGLDCFLTHTIENNYRVGYHVVKNKKNFEISAEK